MLHKNIFIVTTTSLNLPVMGGQVYFWSPGYNHKNANIMILPFSILNKMYFNKARSHCY